MLQILLTSNLLSIILFVMILVSSLSKGNYRYRLATILFLITAAASFCFIYLFLPSRNMLSIITMNVFTAIPLLVWLFLDEDGSYIAKIISTVMYCLLFLLSGIGIVNNFKVKPTYNSIKKETVEHKQAPTFKKNETPVAISPSTVKNRIEKVMSDVPNSQYFSLASTDDIQAQFIDGKPYYVMPLDFAGFYQYFSSHRTLPGYFKVSATDPGDSPEFVKCNIKYAPGMLFSHDAERRIYNANPEYITSKSSPQLEVDDKGTPYYVETLYKPTFLSHRIDYSRMKVAVLNAETGECKTYSTKNLPSFIDEGITSDVASNMNEVFGKDKHGLFYQWFNKAGMIKPTNNGPENGVTSVFNKNGTISYFSDFTNINNDNDSGIGYSMINARTGKLTYYKTKGVMDSNGAKKYANQNFKAQKFKAKMPVLYEIDNTPTWVMQIVDSSDNIHGYYYLDAKAQNINAYASDVNTALDEYNQAMVQNQVTAGNTSKVKEQTIKGTISRVSNVSDDKVLFMLQNNSTVFTVSTKDYSYASLIREGDQVSFKAMVNKGTSIGNVSSFNDNNIR